MQWLCKSQKKHNSSVIYTLQHQQVETQPDTSPPHPATRSLKSLLNQGLSIADAKSAQEKCAKCSPALRSNTVLVRCSVCTKGFHQKCSTGLKASTRDNQWKCEKCTNFQQNCIIESTNCQLAGLSNLLPSQALPAHFRNKPVERWWYPSKIRRTSWPTN